MTAKAPPEPRRLSPSEISTALARFRRLINELQDFDPESVTVRSDPRIDVLEAAIDEALSGTFGHGTPDYYRYSQARNLDRAPVSYARTIPMTEVVSGLVKGKERAILLIELAVRSLDDRLADFKQTEAIDETASARPKPSRDVFVIHGRDSPAKTEVARLIERAGLTAVILHEQPHAGRTIIEKFEAHGGAAGFAVALLTPDDVGGPDLKNLQPRSRQNVIGEMFWFAGRLGRKGVCALKKGDVEMPSDFAGVAYTEMDDRGAWKAALLKELEAAGYTINWSKALA